jgi:hypothetical protein
MILTRQTPVNCLQVFIVGCAVDAQNFIIVFSDHGSASCLVEVEPSVFCVICQTGLSKLELKIIYPPYSCRSSVGFPFTD